MPDITSAVGQPSAIASVPAPQAGVQSSGPIQGLVLTMPQTQPQTSQSSVRDMSTPAGQLTSMVAPFRASAPLSEGVSPFTSKSQSAPAVEYVPFTEPLPVELKPDMYASVRNSDAPATPANQKPPVAPAVQQIPVTTAPQ